MTLASWAGKQLEAVEAGLIKLAETNRIAQAVEDGGVAVHVPPFRRDPVTHTKLRLAMRLVHVNGWEGALSYAQSCIEQGEFAEAMAAAEALDFFRDYRRRTRDTLIVRAIADLIARREAEREAVA